MAERGFGRILFVSSVAAFTGGIVGPHYASSKAGLNGLTHWLASRLAGSDPASDEAKALHIAAVRGRNRLLQALGEARRCISQ